MIVWNHIWEKGVYYIRGRQVGSMEKQVQAEFGRNSQSARLKRIVYQSVAVMLLGGLCLILTIGASLKLSSVQREETQAITYTNQYRLGSKTLTYAVQAYAVTADSQHYDAYMNELNVDKNRDIAWAGLEELDINDEEWAYLEQIAALSNGLVPLEEEAIAAAGKGDTKTAIADVFGEEYEDTITQINSLSDEVINEIQNRKGEQTNRIKVQLMVFEVLLLCSFGFVIIQVIRTNKFSKEQLLVPIRKVEEEMVQLAQGNLHSVLELDEDDSEVGQMVASISLMKKQILDIIEEVSEVLAEMGNGNYIINIRKEYAGDFGQIKESFIKINEEMKETLLTIRDVSGQIDQGTEQLASAAEDLANGSSVQAGKVSELAALLDDMSKSMAKNASGAEETVKIASGAGVALAEGNQKMADLKNAIGEISKCSEQIRSIIGTIEDIATQTNLLSLNAAIEAARAGEAGKGFAVVADQVKSLAEESAKATNETTKLIETTVLAVEKGITIADETAENIENVMAGAKQATEMMGEMAGMLLKDVNSMGRINESIASVSEIVDNNSATSEETAAVSEEQKTQVEAMVGLMNKFKI